MPALLVFGGKMSFRFGESVKRQNASVNQVVKPVVESLENRVLLSGTITISGGVVKILEVMRSNVVWVGVVGSEDRLRHLAVGVIGVDPLAVLVGVGQYVPQGIISVTFFDRAVGINNRQHAAGLIRQRVERLRGDGTSGGCRGAGS